MKRVVLFVTMMITANVFAVGKQEIIPLIKEASAKRESAYVEIRNRITALGANALPLLAEFAVDEALPWQQRLIARICYERIERIKDITTLIETDWYAHPKFNQDWNMLLPGPEARMHEMVEPNLKEAGLWYYYLELEWKMTGERSNIRRGDPDRWESWCTFAVKDNPEERVWFLRICADLMAMSIPPVRAGWVRSILGREKWEGNFQSFPIPKPDAAYLLEHHAPPPVAEEPPFRLGTNIIKRAKQE